MTSWLSNVVKYYQVAGALEGGPAIIDNNALSERRIEEFARLQNEEGAFRPMEGYEDFSGNADMSAEGFYPDGQGDWNDEEGSGFREGIGGEAFFDGQAGEFVPDAEGFDPSAGEGGFVQEETVSEPQEPAIDMEAFQAELDAQIEAARVQADEIISNAQSQAETITSMAHEEAERVRAEAEEAGRNEGFEAGLQEGRAQIEQERENIEMARIQAEKEFHQLVDNLEPEMVDVLTQIYEHVFNVDLRENKAIILHLLQTTLTRMEGGSNILVHISPDDYDMILDEKQRLEEALTNPTSTLEFVEDPLLAGNECIIETDGGVFDCSLGVELSELERKLKLLSFERKT